MKKFFTFLLFCISFTVVFAESMQIVILSSDRYNITESALLKGAIDYTKLAKVRINADIEVDIQEAKEGEELKEQISALKNNKVLGVILSLKETPLPSDFDSFIAQVSDDNFNLCVINPSEELNSALLTLEANRAEESDIIYKFAKKSSGVFDTKTIYLLESDNFAEINEEEASDLIAKTYDQTEFKSLCEKTGDNAFFATPNIDIFYQSKEKDIAKLTSYGIVIANRALLDSLGSLKADTDRRFVIALESSAMSIAFMQEGILSATILQDYFGYGFLSSKALAEKTFDKLNPSEKTIKLTPSLYSKRELEELKALALSWLK